MAGARLQHVYLRQRGEQLLHRSVVNIQDDPLQLFFGDSQDASRGQMFVGACHSVKYNQFWVIETWAGWAGRGRPAKWFVCLQRVRCARSIAATTSGCSAGSQWLACG